MEHWLMHKAALALGISAESSLFFRLYALSIFVLISVSSIHVLHLSGLASLIENRAQNISVSVAYLFDVLARSARVISYVIMHLLSYRHEKSFQNVHKELCELRWRLSGRANVSNHVTLFFVLGFTLVRIVSTLYRLIITEGTLLNFPYHFKFVFNVVMELQLYCLLAELDQSFDAINAKLAQLGKKIPNNALTLCGNVFVDKWKLPQTVEYIGVHRSSLISYSMAVRNLRRVHSSLSDIMRRINSLFGVRLLVDITAQLTALMLRLKMIITWLFDGLNTSVENSDTNSIQIGLERALSAFIVCPIHVGTVFAVVFFCSRTIKKAEQTTIELHKLLNYSVDKEGRDELQIFAMQLLQNKAQFTAAGVFPLDFTLLYSFMGVITTYLVILIQFGASLPRHPTQLMDKNLCVNGTLI
ncbi:putative gustatory receptor 28b [Neocloeon triangulifer]|uniref:putative gustatory receptor 28b n=1 Tax=Neocloeon triangulifer TaxID=2078957 RepID=UPI00286EB62D|nr:putative gustatory receptor 28b [Neocloeon triangulifer]